MQSRLGWTWLLAQLHAIIIIIIIIIIITTWHLPVSIAVAHILMDPKC
ncbi:MAG: hypothetical protein ACT6R6_18745 [Flavobacterium sp.]